MKSNQDLVIDLDFTVHSSFLNLASGHMLAKLSDIAFDFEIKLGTQQAEDDEDTGMAAGSRVAPKLTFDVH